MKSARITFRLQPYQLARALQTIRQLEPNYQLLSINDMVKSVFHDYLAKMSLNRNDAVSDELLDEIRAAMETKPQQIKTNSLDYLMSLKKSPKPKLKLKSLKEAIPSTEDLDASILAEIDSLSKSTKQSQTPSKFNEERYSESEITSVSDFSPPTDWIK